jgi:hypothetical protein
MSPERLGKLLYHKRMFAFAVLGAVALFLSVIGFVYIMLLLGVWQTEDR